MTGSAAGGVLFSATLMTILSCHEMGHYVTARRHGVDASLPYFIPLPFAMGTLGAVIRMRSPIERRDALLDVGAAGPLAGLFVAIPLLVVGLVQSPVLAPDGPAMIEGNSLLYAALKLATKGELLPSATGLDVQLGPVAMAAWVGLLVTFINLLPIGQLDGGHIAFAYFGDRYQRASAWLHGGLLAVGIAVALFLGLQASAAGRAPGAAATYGAQSAMPWIVWAILLFIMRRLSGGVYHPPVGTERLPRRHRALFWIMVAVFVGIFMPVPMREALR